MLSACQIAKRLPTRILGDDLLVIVISDMNDLNQVRVCRLPTAHNSWHANVAHGL